MARKKKGSTKREKKIEHVNIGSDFSFDPEEIQVESLDFVVYHAPKDKNIRLCFPDATLFGRSSETIDAGGKAKLRVFPGGKLYTTYAFGTEHECKGGGGNEGKTKVGGG